MPMAGARAVGGLCYSDNDPSTQKALDAFLSHIGNVKVEMDLSGTIDH